MALDVHEHVMMADPVDAQDQEAGYVADEFGQHLSKLVSQLARFDFGNLEFQHQQGDYDGEDAVAERVDTLIMWYTSRPCSPSRRKYVQKSHVPSLTCGRPNS